MREASLRKEAAELTAEVEVACTYRKEALEEATALAGKADQEDREARRQRRKREEAAQQRRRGPHDRKHPPGDAADCRRAVGPKHFELGFVGRGSLKFEF